MGGLHWPMSGKKKYVIEFISGQVKGKNTGGGVSKGKGKSPGRGSLKAGS